LSGYQALLQQSQETYQVLECLEMFDPQPNPTHQKAKTLNPTQPVGRPNPWTTLCAPMWRRENHSRVWQVPKRAAARPWRPLEGGVVGLRAKTSMAAVLDDEVPDDDEHHTDEQSAEERSSGGRRRRRRTVRARRSTCWRRSQSQLEFSQVTIAATRLSSNINHPRLRVMLGVVTSGRVTKTTVTPFDPP